MDCGQRSCSAQAVLPFVFSQVLTLPSHELYLPMNSIIPSLDPPYLQSHFFALIGGTTK